jgi:hypothetical protein
MLPKVILAQMRRGTSAETRLALPLPDAGQLFLVNYFNPSVILINT